MARDRLHATSDRRSLDGILYENTETGVWYLVGALSPSRYASKHPSGDAFRVPENHVFAMGDNRGKSLDGRAWGSVPMDAVKGKAVVIYWSTDPDRDIPWWKVHRKMRFRRIGRRVKSQFGDVDPDRLRDPDE